MNLWLYSSGDSEDNELMDEDLFVELALKRPTFTFIPAHEDDAELCYNEFIERFSSYGYVKFRMLDPETNTSKRAVRAMLDSDLVYLSGGNTFHFLKNLRDSGLINDLRYYARSGGFLAGHSAGAILMTPHIRTAAIPEFDRDQNDVGIKNILAMRLSKFEFFPHYEDTPAYAKALEQASAGSPWPIYGAEDGSGVVMSQKGLRFYGNTWSFYMGLKVKLS